MSDGSQDGWAPKDPENVKRTPKSPFYCIVIATSAIVMGPKPRYRMLLVAFQSFKQVAFAADPSPGTVAQGAESDQTTSRLTTGLR